jgi:Fe-S cluster assembly protein SufD
MVINTDYLERSLESWPFANTKPSSWLNQLRANAIDQASMLRLPTKRDEEWRFTDISALTHLPFRPSQPENIIHIGDVEHLFLKEAKIRLVFIDGYFSSSLSIFDPTSLTVGNLPMFLSSNSAYLESHLGRLAKYEDNVFTALNTAFLSDAAVVSIPKNATVRDPIHLLFIATQNEVTSYPRCLLVCEEGSNITLVEEYIAHNNSKYITNSVSEFFLAPHANVKHIRIQRENLEAFHLANCAVSLDRASQYQSINISTGARISRYNHNVFLNDEAAECVIDGLTMISNQQLADTHSCIDHIKPHGTSYQQHKCIVNEKAHAVFNGRIVVRPHAQQTNSSQSSRNLLLSKTAQVDTKPQLEIFANDVKCAHGATVGQLEEEELFYLESRGLSPATARSLLTYAFGAEIINRIPVTSLRQRLEQAILTQESKS